MFLKGDNLWRELERPDTRTTQRTLKKKGKGKSLKERQKLAAASIRFATPVNKSVPVVPDIMRGKFFGDD